VNTCQFKYEIQTKTEFNYYFWTQLRVGLSVECFKFQILIGTYDNRRTFTGGIEVVKVISSMK